MHIGKKIKEVFLLSNLKVSEFAQKLNTVRDNVYKIFNRDDISINLLIQISNILQHNFIKYYLPDEFTESTQNEYLNLENKLLKDQIELQKKYISSLEKVLKKEKNAT